MAIPDLVVMGAEIKSVISPTNRRFPKPKNCCDIVKKLMISQVVAFL
jgi:hypothetical protein